jgi:hypothetical protein
VLPAVVVLPAEVVLPAVVPPPGMCLAGVAARAAESRVVAAARSRAVVGWATVPRVETHRTPGPAPNPDLIGASLHRAYAAGRQAAVRLAAATAAADREFLVTGQAVPAAARVAGPRSGSRGLVRKRTVRPAAAPRPGQATTRTLRPAHSDVISPLMVAGMVDATGRPEPSGLARPHPAATPRGVAPPRVHADQEIERDSRPAARLARADRRDRVTSFRASTSRTASRPTNSTRKPQQNCAPCPVIWPP